MTETEDLEERVEEMKRDFKGLRDYIRVVREGKNHEEGRLWNLEEGKKYREKATGEEYTIVDMDLFNICISLSGGRFVFRWDFVTEFEEL